jgi:hypothetical protein
MFLSGSNGVVNTSAIRVISGASNATVLSVISTPSINIAGTSYTSLVAESVNTQIFTANGTWTKPSWATTGNELVIVHMWGGGGGGNTSAGTGYGGGGGAFVYGYYKASQLGSVAANTANVVVGLGGAPGFVGGTSSVANATNGLFSAYGGGFASAGVNGGGGGGGWFSAGGTTVGGGPLPANTSVAFSTFGGGAASLPGSGHSIYGGSAGVLDSGGSVSIFGGGGGSYTGTVGTSVYGGWGGNTSVAPTTPGGGGAGGSANNSAGARGEVRVYTLRYTGP